MGKMCYDVEMKESDSKCARIPRNYRGNLPTGRGLSTLLPKVLRGIQRKHQLRPDLVVASWKALVGPQISGMSKAQKFEGGKLFVKVKNSSLLSVLSTYEKERLLALLQKKFPAANIKEIIFRIG